MVPEMIIDAEMEHSIHYEVRAAHDIAMWQRGNYAVPNGTQNWMVVRVEPAAGSGSATVPGGYINAETGELEMPAGAQTVIVKSGRWRRLDGTTAEAAGKYHWFESQIEDKRRMDPEDVYSPFEHGGTLLFAPNWEADGIQQFEAPVLLFEEWAAAAQQAIATNLPSENGMLEPPPQLLNALPRLRVSPNPLVAAWAWRYSLTRDPDGTQADLDSASGRVLTVRTRLLLDIGSELSVQRVVQAVRGTHDLSRLEAMAAGALSAAQLPSAGNGASARQVLGTIAEQLRGIDPRGTGTPRLRAILALAGFGN
jgi:hypothetical protein